MPYTKYSHGGFDREEVNISFKWISKKIGTCSWMSLGVMQKGEWLNHLMLLKRRPTGPAEVCEGRITSLMSWNNSNFSFEPLSLHFLRILPLMLHAEVMRSCLYTLFSSAWFILVKSSLMMVPEFFRDLLPFSTISLSSLRTKRTMTAYSLLTMHNNTKTWPW